MRRSTVYGSVLVGSVAVVIALQAWGYPESSRKTKAACIACHVHHAGGAELTEAGKAFKASNAKHPPTTQAAVEYVGSQKCQICHMREHKSWRETAHATALQRLETADPKRAAEISAKLKIPIQGSPAETDGCVTCHVTGHKLPGGYPAADSAKNAALGSVGCESCHGPGGRHVSAPSSLKKKFIQRNAGTKLCTQCHTPAMTPKFDYEEHKKRGVHAVAATTK